MSKGVNGTPSKNPAAKAVAKHFKSPYPRAHGHKKSDRQGFGNTRGKKG